MAPTVRKFTLEGSEIFQAARWVDKATSKDSHMFSINIENAQMIIESYNGIHASKAAVAVDQKFDGDTRFSVDSKMFLDALKTLGNNTIQATFTERKLTLVAPKTRFNLPVSVPRNVNTLPDMPERFGTVEVKDFIKLLAHATSTATDDPSAPSLTTVHFSVEPQNGFFKMMSTDRFRMVIRKVKYTPSPDASQENFTFDVDAVALKSLIADLGDADTISLYAEDKGSALFGIGTNNQRASVLMKDVKPIDYSAFEKLTFSNSIVIDRKSLQQAISKTKPAVSGSTKVGTLVIDGDDLSLISGDEQQGTDMECDLVSSDLDAPLSLTSNLDYLGSILKAGTSQYVKFGLNGSGKPVLVYEMEDENSTIPDYFSLFMTVRV